MWKSGVIVKDKMDSLESEKGKIATSIQDTKTALENSKLDEDLIEQYLIKDLTDLHNKSANDLKTIISTYVESIVVFDDRVEINLIISFVHTIV